MSLTVACTVINTDTHTQSAPQTVCTCELAAAAAAAAVMTDVCETQRATD